MTTFPVRRAIGACLLVAVASCAPDSLVDVNSTSEVVDPSVVRTATGATQLYYMAVAQFGADLGGNPRPSGGAPYGRNYVMVSARWTDELMWVQNAFGQPFGPGDDERNDGTITTWSSDAGFNYNPMQSTRIIARQAREALTRFNPTAPRAWQGRLYAQEAYTITLMAEFFCSGIPLSTLALDGAADFTAGRSYDELLDAAVALFDSAITASADTARFLNLAKVGKGRALLDQGKFAD